MAKKKEKEVRLKPMVFSTIKVSVVGKTPLLMDRMPNEILQQIEAKSQSKKKIKTKEYSKEEKIEMAIHYTPSGNVGFPADGFKGGIIEATTFFGSDIYKKEAKGVQIMNVENGLVPIEFETKTVCERPIKNRGSTRLKASPQFNGWSAELLIQFDANVLSVNDVVNLLNYAGHHIGIGAWRPSSKCGGSYGMYEVDGIKEVSYE